MPRQVSLNDESSFKDYSTNPVSPVVQTVLIFHGKLEGGLQNFVPDYCCLFSVTLVEKGRR